MKDDKFIQNKNEVVKELYDVRSKSSNIYNKAQESLNNGLFTAATAYIAIILAFANNLQEVFNDYSWIIVASIFSFSASLIPWMVEKIIISIVYRKDIIVSSKLSDVAVNEIWDEKSLATINRIAAVLLVGGKTSSIPIVVQIVLFLLGVLFAVIAIAIVLL